MRNFSSRLPLRLRASLGERLLQAWASLPSPSASSEYLRALSLFWSDFQDSFHYASPSFRRHYQAKKIRHLISSAKTTLAYSLLWEKATLNRKPSSIVLSSLPVISKEHLAAFWPHGTKPASVSWDRILRQEATSGVTAPPLQFFSDRKYLPRLNASFLQALRWAGADMRKDIVTFSPPYNYMNVIGPTQKVRAVDFLRLLSAEKYHEISQYIRVFNAGILMGYPSYLGLLVASLTELGIPPPKVPPFRAVLTYGERLTNKTRERLQSFFRVPIFGVYELAETGIVGIECSAHAGFHVDESAHVVEILDEEGINVPAGKTGRIVITTFLNEVNPFIRYDTGDVGFLSEGRCLCGRTSPLLTVQGRTHDMADILSSETEMVEDIMERIGFYPGSYQFTAIKGAPPILDVFPWPFSTDRPRAEERLKRFSSLFPNIKVRPKQDPVMVLRGKIVNVIRRPNMTIRLW